MKMVDFMLFGKRFQAISAGPLDPFNHAISMVVVCEDQAELDRYWSALLQGGEEDVRVAPGPVRRQLAGRPPGPG